jgi:hypothetical protein
MSSKKQENAVKNLINLYTVVVGVALSLAVRALLDGNEGLESISLAAVMLFIAFLATLMPFYHGALRHLDDAYIENANEHIKDGALLVDFLLLFLHAVAFVILALLLKKPAHFVWVLTVILGLDVFWGLFAYFASSSRGELTAEAKWTIINFVFVGASIWYLVAQDIYLASTVEPLKLAFPIVFICLLRTTVDYIWCRKFYFAR